jgi:VanZ like family
MAAIAALVLLIVFGSLAPQPLVPGGLIPDKVIHYVFYLALAVMGSGITTPERLWRSMLRCFLLGLALEVAQFVVTDRRLSEWADVAANAAGILTAWLIVGWGRAGWGMRAAARMDRRRPS